MRKSVLLALFAVVSLMPSSCRFATTDENPGDSPNTGAPREQSDPE